MNMLVSIESSHCDNLQTVLAAQQLFVNTLFIWDVWWSFALCELVSLSPLSILHRQDMHYRTALLGTSDSVECRADSVLLT